MLTLELRESGSVAPSFNCLSAWWDESLFTSLMRTLSSSSRSQWASSWLPRCQPSDQFQKILEKFFGPRENHTWLQNLLPGLQKLPLFRISKAEEGTVGSFPLVAGRWCWVVDRTLRLFFLQVVHTTNFSEFYQGQVREGLNITP